MAKKTTKKKSNSKTNIKKAPIKSKTPIKSKAPPKQNKVPPKKPKSKAQTRSKITHGNGKLQLSQQSQNKAVRNNINEKMKSDSLSNITNENVSDRMKQTIKYYLQSLKNKDSTKNQRGKIFLVGRPGLNEEVQNTNKSKAIRKEPKKQAGKRPLAPSTTFQQKQIEVISISGSELSNLRSSSIAESSQLNSSSDKRLSLNLDSNNFNKSKKGISKKQIKGLFGRGKIHLPSSFEESQPISRRSSRSASRKSHSPSAVFVSSQSLSNQYQNTTNKISQEYLNRIESSNAIEPEFESVSPLESDLMSTPEERKEYSVEKIASSKISKGGQVLYQIKWIGYPEDENTFEPLKNLSNVLAMVVEFEQKQKAHIQKRLKDELKQTKQEFNLKLKQKIDEKDKKNDEATKKFKEVQKKLKELEKLNKVKQSKCQFQLKLQLQMQDQSCLNKTKTKSETKIETVSGHYDKKINQETFFSIPNSKVKLQKPRQMRIQHVLELSLTTVKSSISGLNIQNCEFLSTRHSSENQEAITEQKRNLQFQQEERYLEKCLPPLISNDISPKNLRIDYFDSDPICHIKLETPYPYREISIDFMNMNDHQKENPEHNRELQMILEEKSQIDPLSLGFQEERLIQNFANQSYPSQEIQLLQYSFPMNGTQNYAAGSRNNQMHSPQQIFLASQLMNEFDCLNNFYTHESNQEHASIL